MKKLILVIIALLSISVAFYSCNKDDNNGDDPVDTDPVITTEVVKTNREAEALGNSVYARLQTLSSSFSFLLELATESTISFEGDEPRGAPVISRFEHDAKTGYDTPHDYPNKLFLALYTSIGNSNIAIEKLDSSKVTDKLSQETKDLVKARVKFTRALGYHYLVQIFGEVPLRLKQADAVNTTRVPIDTIYKYIVKDLTEAEAYLPEYDRIKSNASKGAANALLARVYLSWGQHPLSQAEVEAIKDGQADPAYAKDDAKLEKAVEYADKVINSGQYQLLEDYNRNFGVAGENGEEHIYTIHHDGDGVDALQSNHQTHCTFTNRFTNPAADFHIGPADPTVVNRFDDADKRKLLSYTQRLFNTDEGNKEYTWAYPLTSALYGKWIHRSGYAVTGDIPTIERAGGSVAAQPNNINRIEIRYAEVLLIKAEALFFLGRPAEALPFVNQLRQRAFGDNAHNLTSLTKENLFREWELELTFEQKRWTNLVRWKTLIQTVRTVNQFEYFKEGYATEEAATATAAGKGYHNTDDAAQSDYVNAPFHAKAYKHLHAKYNNVRGKHYRFPIPLFEGIEKGVLPQNPGYASTNTAPPQQ
jgi:hypothetical protein